ncbi:MAG: UDP-N-acetylmuramoyl-tripeptide--D-alanyl-D-alanine ligase [Phycisphaerae bacterium]|jgi:UDP-N-acetylmuramoyl-tripeptide--D-alanyl-D-alanine ligase
MIAMSLTDVANAVGATYEPHGSADRVTRVVTDSREVEAGDLFVAIAGDRADGHAFIAEAHAKGAVAALCTRPGLSRNLPGRSESAGRCLVVDDTVTALGRLASHYRQKVMHVATVVVGVTGTNGKTTTKCMIDHVLSGAFPGKAAPKSFNNHLGVPLTLLSADAEDRYLIVEIGTNSPGEVAALSEIAKPHAGVITSISEAHLQRLRGIDGVAKEKAALLQHIDPHGLAVVNIDRGEIEPYLATAACARAVTVGVSPSAQLSVAGATGDISGSSFKLNGRYDVQLPMPGMHHATNAAATFAVARWFGVAPERIIERLRSFAPPAGRTRTLVGGGTVLVDDSYNANPASMSSAVDTLRRASSTRRVFVMGDMLELGAESAAYHERTVRDVLNARIEVLIGVGPAMSRAIGDLGAESGDTECIRCGGADAASDELLSLIRRGDTIWVKGSRAMQLDRVVKRWQSSSVSKRMVATRPVRRGAAVCAGPETAG